MKSSIIDIAKTLSSHFNDLSKNEYSIFLCGGASPKDAKFRNALKEKITDSHTRDKFNVYLPEDIFLELIMGYQKYDSLSLENILAKSVNSIVIPLQSPGTYTELGAFSNREELRNKLIIINDPKYKKIKSFINSGPIALLLQSTNSIVINSPYDYSNIKDLASNIKKSTRKISKTSSIEYSLKNPLSSINFYLALVFVFEPITKINIEHIIHAIDESVEAEIVMETVLNALVNQRKIIMNTKEEYIVVKSALTDLDNLYTTKKMQFEIIDFLTDLRLNAMSITLRRKNRKLWERSSI
jgi:hypothetical protein